MSYPQWSTSLKTAPTAEPVALADAKVHLRVPDDDEDALIEGLIAAAREWVEAFTNRALLAQTWYLKLDRFPCGEAIWLPRPPLTSITSISYVDTNGATQTWAATTGYELAKPAGPTAQYAQIQPVYNTVYPSTRYQLEAVTIEYVCGYGTADDVPQSIKSAMLLLVAHLYANREASSAVVNGMAEIPFGVQALLGPYVCKQW